MARQVAHQTEMASKEAQAATERAKLEREKEAALREAAEAKDALYAKAREQVKWLLQNTIAKDGDGRVGVVVEPVNDALETKLRWTDGSTGIYAWRMVVLLFVCRAQLIDDFKPCMYD